MFEFSSYKCPKFVKNNNTTIISVSWSEGGAGCPDTLDHLAGLEGRCGWAQGGVYEHPQSDDVQLPIL